MKIPRNTEVCNEATIHNAARAMLMYFPLLFPVAEITARIHYLRSIHEQFPRNKRRVFVPLKELIEKRRRKLKELRRMDYKRYEWVLEKLDLFYKPQPPTMEYAWRKPGLRKLTKAHCDGIKQERLDEYRNELRATQLEFLSEKLKNLEFIRKEQSECGVPVTVSQQQINDVKAQFDELKKVREVETQGVDPTKKWKIY